MYGGRMLDVFSYMTPSTFHGQAFLAKLSQSLSIKCENSVPASEPSERVTQF